MILFADILFVWHFMQLVTETYYYQPIAATIGWYL